LLPNRVAVLGPGLLGGSILLAARARLPGVALAVWSHDPAERAEVQRRALADGVHAELSAAVRDADLVILCTPVGVMAKLAGELAPHLAAGAVVTDVGSVKTPVVRALTPLFLDAATGHSRFVGGHPMAGRELAGLGAARDDLFAHAVCLLTPEADTAPVAVARVGAFWQALGVARVETLAAAEHDETVALVSHLPHLLAAALLETVAGARTDALARSGPGLRDVTRPAAGASELWTEILSLNRTAVTSALRAFSAQLARLRPCLEPGGEPALADFLRDAAARRRELPAPTK